MADQSRPGEQKSLLVAVVVVTVLFATSDITNFALRFAIVIVGCALAVLVMHLVTRRRRR